MQVLISFCWTDEGTKRETGTVAQLANISAAKVPLKAVFSTLPLDDLINAGRCRYRENYAWPEINAEDAFGPYGWYR